MTLLTTMSPHISLVCSSAWATIMAMPRPCVAAEELAQDGPEQRRRCRQLQGAEQVGKHSRDADLAQRLHGPAAVDLDQLQAHRICGTQAREHDDERRKEHRDGGEADLRRLAVQQYLQNRRDGDGRQAVAHDREAHEQLLGERDEQEQQRTQDGKDVAEEKPIAASCTVVGTDAW